MTRWRLSWSSATSRLPGQARVGPGRDPTTPWLTRGIPPRSIREHLAKRGIKAVIPTKDDQADARIRKGSRGGRRAAFDTVRYRQRNNVERAAKKLRGTRAVATR